MTDIRRLETAFEAVYKSRADIVVRAPGRVELIGCHTDYNEGFVLPMAIDRQCVILARRRADRKVVVYSDLFAEKAEFDLNAEQQPGSSHWSKYAVGVATLLLREGKRLGGADLYISCDIPAGGGLSSSAAIEVAYAKTFLAVSGEEFDPLKLAFLCQQAEHVFAGSPCGIMDQFICVFGKAGHALFLDCRTQQNELVPVPFEHASILIADTKVKHDLGQSGYPLRRKQCFEVVDVIKKDTPGVTHLRDVELGTLQKYQTTLDAVHYARAKHILTENQRVLRMVEGFRKGDLKLAGQMMNESHASCRDDYDISCEELNFLAEAVRRCEGVYGSRMSGGGFGGCVVALVENRFAAAIGQHLTNIYQEKYGKDPGVFCTGAAAGAEVLRR